MTGTAWRRAGIPHAMELDPDGATRVPVDSMTDATESHVRFGQRISIPQRSLGGPPQGGPPPSAP